MKVKTLVLGPLETNTYIVEKGGEYLIVDPGDNSTYLDEIVKSKNVKYILLTHGHYDHIAGVKRLSEMCKAKIVIHKEDAQMLYDEKKSRYADFFMDDQPKAKADIETSDGDVLSFAGADIKVMHTPGHTHGSVVYIFEDDNTLFSGDTLFKLSAGRTDLCDGDQFDNARQELKSLKKIAKLEGDYTVYPGHGESTSLEYERQFNPYMRG